MTVGEFDASRDLAIRIASSIAHHCRSPQADAYGHMAATMLGALVAADGSGHTAAVAHARRVAAELHRISAVCPDNHRCGLCPLTERLIDSLRAPQH